VTELDTKSMFRERGRGDNLPEPGEKKKGKRICIFSTLREGKKKEKGGEGNVRSRWLIAPGARGEKEIHRGEARRSKKEKKKRGATSSLFA